MFDINLIKRITKSLDRPFFLSKTSSLEYIINRDIHEPEILVDSDVESLLLVLQLSRPLTYEKREGWYVITFRDYEDHLKMKQIDFSSLKNSLKSPVFNYQAVAFEINKEPDHALYSLEGAYCHLHDPHGQYPVLRSHEVEVIDLSRIQDEGQYVYDMVQIMAKYDLSLTSDNYEDLKVIRKKIRYASIELKDTIFNIFKTNKSDKYWKILHELGALQVMEDLIVADDYPSFWERGIQALARVESILSRRTYFQEYVCRGLQQNLMTSYYGGFSKLQLLKFSVLFYYGHQGVPLEGQSYFRKSSPLSRFCNFFDLKKEACLYYAHVVDSSQRHTITFGHHLMKRVPLTAREKFHFFKSYDENAIDILLIQYVYQTISADNLSEMVMKENLEKLFICYLTSYCDLKSINSELSTLEINPHQISDELMLKWIDEVKEGIFLGQLEYKREPIIDYLHHKIQAMNL